MWYRILRNGDGTFKVADIKTGLLIAQGCKTISDAHDAASDYQVAR